MKIEVTKDERFAAAMQDSLKKNDNYCPCVVASKGKEQYLCPCERFRINSDVNDYCPCGYFVRVE